jgi:DNA recombination protein RmuC
MKIWCQRQKRRFWLRLRRIHNLGVAGDKDKLAIEYPEAPGDVRDLKNAELETGDDYIDAEEVDEK